MYTEYFDTIYFHTISSISTTFISTKNLNFQTLRTIGTGFGKLNDQKMKIAFIILRIFTVSYTKLLISKPLNLLVHGYLES